MSPRPTASLSLDLDNQWSYMKTHGDPGWQTFPSYLDLVVPKAIRLLEELQLTITVFVVGRDAEESKNRGAIESIANAGHYIGNHSFNHEPWLHLYEEAELNSEIMRAERAIEDVVGTRPVGFRGPGYSLSRATLKVLSERGYLYDASSLPTFVGPLARRYYFAKTRLGPEQAVERKFLFGSIQDGFRPNRPYRWRIEGEGTSTNLLEIPVTTMPVTRLPIHLSYLVYLASFSRRLALLYFRTALRLCRLTATPPSILLHSLDFLGSDDVEQLSFFPGMNLESEAKREFVFEVLRILTAKFDVRSLERFALEISDAVDSKLVEPKFASERSETLHEAAF